MDTLSASAVKYWLEFCSCVRAVLCPYHFRRRVIDFFLHLGGQGGAFAEGGQIRSITKQKKKVHCKLMCLTWGRGRLLQHRWPHFSHGHVFFRFKQVD